MLRRPPEIQVRLNREIREINPVERAHHGIQNTRNRPKHLKIPRHQPQANPAKRDRSELIEMVHVEPLAGHRLDPQPVTWSSPHQTPATEPSAGSAEVRADRGPYDCQPRSMAASQDRSGARLKPLPRHDNRVPKLMLPPTRTYADAGARSPQTRRSAAVWQLTVNPSPPRAALSWRRARRGTQPVAGWAGPALWFAGRSAGHAPGRSGADHNVTVGVHGPHLRVVICQSCSWPRPNSTSTDA